MKRTRRMKRTRQAFGDGPLAVIGERLAGREVPDGDGGVELDRQGECPEAEQTPEMAGQFHIPLPGNTGPQMPGQGRPR